MPNYLRPRVEGGTVFLTIVTYQRKPLFADEANVLRLRQAISEVKKEMPFEFDAAVILPDHMHFLWSLPAGDDDYSTRIGRFKVEFTRLLRGKGDLPGQVSLSRRKHRESDVWQRRFADHLIRDADDFERHLEYIHYNPVKHGFVTCPHAWRFSSFSKWVERKAYEHEWGWVCEGRLWTPPDWKEIEKDAGEL